VYFEDVKETYMLVGTTIEALDLDDRIDPG